MISNRMPTISKTKNMRTLSIITLILNVSMLHRNIIPHEMICNGMMIKNNVRSQNASVFHSCMKLIFQSRKNIITDIDYLSEELIV